MNEFKHLMDTIKYCAVDVVSAGVPSDVCFGTVINNSPLQIKLDDNGTIVLDNQQLILCRNVTEYKFDMTVDHIVEKRAGGSHDPSFEAHDHQYKGRKTFLVHNGLVVGEKVVMVKMSGGQKYVVIDRVGV